ncbi:MAG: hypothetical protein D6721_03830 [Gammaproteobacteria bacterium]|nr:MAG: hypothetical protein D6721_03830 [Gammaproteobacteria bacterium]
MVDVLKSDEEQAEVVKKWLRENGGSLLTGLLLGLAVLFGGKAWMQYRARQAEAASNEYVRLALAVQRHDEQQATAFHEALLRDHSGSVYAVLAALEMARLQVELEKPEAARAQLQWALEHADTDELRHLARLRLARVWIALGKPDEAAALFQGVDPGPWQALYEEVRGDAALAAHRYDEARRHYRAALAALPKDSPARTLLEAKRDDTRRGPESGSR